MHVVTLFQQVDETRSVNVGNSHQRYDDFAIGLALGKDLRQNRCAHCGDTGLLKEATTADWRRMHKMRISFFHGAQR